MLQKKLSDLRVGTFEDIATASMESTIFDVISLMSEKGVASIPIVDSDGILPTTLFGRTSLINNRRCFECL